MSADIGRTVIEGFKADKYGGVDGWVEAEDDSRIYVKVRGVGSPLLVMGGVGSGVFTSEEIADQFADKRMLISYDRRCTFRSSGNTESDFDIAQQCRDVLRILEACNLSSVSVFATCASTSIALELLKSHPEIVDAMIVHDPLNFRVLSDAEVHIARFTEYHRITQEVGAVAGMGAFLADFELPFPKEFQMRMRRDGRFMVLRELLPSISYLPDVEALRQHRNRIVMATGQQCLEHRYSIARTAQVLAEQVGCQFAVLPGNHTGYFHKPVAFAEAALRLIESLPSFASDEFFDIIAT